MEKVSGTNCFNCLYVAKNAEKVRQEDLNNQGGLDPKSNQDMQRAEKADLITLPGGSKSEVAAKKFCNNKSVQMYVTERMCCAYWDNEDAWRPWKQQKKPMEQMLS